MDILDNQTIEQEARHFGIDISLIEYNLSLTPEERLWQNQQILSILNEIQPDAKQSQ